MSAADHTPGEDMAPEQNDTDVIHASSLHKAAHAYATNGVAIFPCRPHDKRPLGGNGFHDATTDLDQIDTWWTAHPDANIGVALGANGVFALDVDGPDGRTTLDRLETDHGPLPDTYQVVTGRVEGSGRHHVYLQPDHGPPVRNHQIGDHLETRGDGGYIIAPPSIHPSGRPYMAMGRWSDITHAPDWLIALTYKPAPTLHTSSVPTTVSPATRRLEAVCAKVVMAPEGTRNNILNWAAYRAGQSIGAGQLDPDTAADMLLTAATRAGLNIDESTATVRSGMEAGANDPDPTTPTTADIPAVTTLAPPSSGTTVVEVPDDGTHPWIADIRDRARAGRDFLTSTRGPIPAIWGEQDSDAVLWSEGEGLLIAGPPGTGKTTLVQQAVAGLLGHQDHTSVLGHPIQGPRNVLYLALDRPRQIGRALGRILQPDDPSVGRLTVWDQPLPFDPAQHHNALTDMCRALDCDVVIVDSLYDLSPSIVKPEIAGEVVRTLKQCVNDGIDLAAIHHGRKQPTQGRNKPSLDELYGGMQLGAGFGSVLWLKGAAGDLTVSLLHLKQPGEVVGPLELTHDHQAGTTSVEDRVDLVALATVQGSILVIDAARAITREDEPDRAAKQRAQRTIDGLVKRGLLKKDDPGRGKPIRYLPAGPTVIGASA